MPQIMLLLHMQIRRYFNKICDNNAVLHPHVIWHYYYMGCDMDLP
jgi:hypothetical protein